VLTSRRRSAGFTLIELLTVMVIASIMFALAFPIIGTWVKNNQIRTVAESVQNGLRFAQVQAVALNQETGFFLANNPPPGSTALSGLSAVSPANGWFSDTLTTINGTANADTAVVPIGLQVARLGNVASGIQIAGPTGVCFNSFGRMTGNTSTGTGATCPIPAASNVLYTYTVSAPSTPAARVLNVTLNVSGQVRICDPVKVLSPTNPDGC
jgi:type IV fimbrial biogenesis protein FimT